MMLDHEQVEWFGKLAARIIALGVPVTRVQIGISAGGPSLLISCGDRHWSIVVPDVMWRICKAPHPTMDGLAMKLEAEARECARSMIRIPAGKAVEAGE